LNLLLKLLSQSRNTLILTADFAVPRRGLRAKNHLFPTVRNIGEFNACGAFFAFSF
jgi:hypothetical protein